VIKLKGTGRLRRIKSRPFKTFLFSHVEIQISTVIKKMKTSVPPKFFGGSGEYVMAVFKRFKYSYLQ
jgi:hypothetical protein